MVSTTIAAGSNGASLPQGTINVASTTGFDSSGDIFVKSDAGIQTITYTGTTGTTFTGCTGGTGTLATGNSVTQSQDKGNAIFFTRHESNISPAVVSTDQTLNPGSAYAITYGWANTLSALGSVNGTDITPIQKFSQWPPVDATGSLLAGLKSLRKFYKMVGFYTTGSVYESFVNIGAPTVATTVNPDTGHTLIDTYVAAYWTAYF